LRIVSVANKETTMQLAMIGLGRMGGNMVRRLLRDGHDCAVYARSADGVRPFEEEGAKGFTSYDDLAAALETPRAVWIMVPAAAVDSVIGELAPHLEAGDIVIDGGNSYYRDDLARAERLRARGIHFLDVGTSGGVFGLERGYCLMIGGEDEPVARLDPVFRSLAPGVDAATRTAGDGSAPRPSEMGYLHCGPSGAGHFVKMVHNGIEYGLMAAYAEGLNILHRANIGNEEQEVSAEVSPLRDPEYYRYDLKVSEIAELWRRGSVVASWLLDLTARALAESPDLEGFGGRVSDSGEGRWTSIAAIEEGVPAPVLATALYERFTSRGEADFANRLLSAMRQQFGGHAELTGKGTR
jgi:6-phosphogluconate dehydrogenase